MLYKNSFLQQAFFSAVVEACKKHFSPERKMDRDLICLGNNDISTYEAALREFERKFARVPVRHFINTWLENWKEKVVRALAPL